MYYFLLYFITYVFGLLLTIYVNSYIAIIVGILMSLALLINKRNFINSLIIVLIFILAIVNINYNSKSCLLQYNQKIVDIRVDVINKLNSKENSDYNCYKVVVRRVNGKKINENSMLYTKNKFNVFENSTYDIKLKISELSQNKNRMLFDYKNYLRSKKIFINLYANNKPKLIKKDISFIRKGICNIKKRIEDIMYTNMDESNANVVLSIFLGDKSYLDKDFYNGVKTIGIAHLFAVSGFHVGIIYKTLSILLLYLGFSKRNSGIITWIFLWLYGFSIGLPTSVLRSLIMFTFLFGADMLYRKYNTLNSIVISAFIILIYSPYNLFDAGFQLSYAAIIGIFVYNKYISSTIKVKNKIVSNILIYVFVQVLIFPILAYYFNYFSIMGLFYNIVLLPVYMVCLVIIFVLIFIGIVSPFTVVIPLRMIDNTMYFLNKLILVCANFKYNGFYVQSFSLIKIIYYYAFVILILSCKYINNFKIKKCMFSIYILSVLINFCCIPYKYRGLEMNVVDVGQGIFICMRYNNKVYVFDAGSNTKNIGEYVCVPYILKNGLFNIDKIFLSHYHVDHYSGINDLLDNYKVNNVYTSHEDVKKLIDFDMEIIKSGNKMKIDKNLNISILWPVDSYISDNENNMSNVYLVRYGNIKILVTGDIEKEAEQFIMDKYNLPNIDILMVPHHGSKTSSTLNFINTIKPKLAIFSYGINNYGIPHDDVIKRYDNINSKIMTTFYDGEINILALKDKIYYNSFNGVCSGNYNDITSTYRNCNIILLVMVSLFIFKYGKYIVDRRNEL